MLKMHRFPKAVFPAGLFFAVSFMATAVTTVAHAAPVPAQQLTHALRWRSVGPYIGGRVTSVAGVASEPNLFYAAYAGGGVWKSDNYGQSWEFISPDKYFDNENIGAIAVAPSNPNIIYAGTGDPSARDTILTGDGMYKSTDGGKTWTHIGLEKTHIISWIEIDPDNPNVVYVAALGHQWAPNPQRGVYKTTDGGRTWEKILFVNDQTGAITLAMDPSNPQVLYASMWQFYRRAWTFSSGGPGSGVYKTVNGGETWTNITHNPGLPDGILGKVGLAVAPSDPSIVYARIQAKVRPGHPGGLYRSDNAGKTWHLVNDSDRLTQRAFYFMRVYVDPKDPNTIYMPGSGFYVSYDGGKTIGELFSHGDDHAVWINPVNPNVMIEGNDGGAMITQNNWKTWSSTHNQPTAQIYHVALNNQFPFDIYGPQQDEGSSEGPSAVRSGPIPPVWRGVSGGENSWTQPVPGEPWITVGTGYFSLTSLYNRRTGSNRSISPAPFDRDDAADSELIYRSSWIHHPLLFVHDDLHELLDGTQYVLESKNLGHSWTRISPDLTRNDKSKQGWPGGPISRDVTSEENFDTISALAVSPSNADIIWAGSDDGLVHVTTDGGGHWSLVTPEGLPKWITATSIVASSNDPGTAYLAESHYMWDDFKPYVYKTTDYGKHWTKIVDGIPDDQYVYSLAQDPNDPSLLFLGTNKTAYVSFDSGANWQPLTLNLPPVPVSGIAIQPEQHAVVISTFGRGYWILDNLTFLEQLNTTAHVAQSVPYLFAPQQAWLVTHFLQTGFFGFKLYGGTNKPAGVTVFFYLPNDFVQGTPVKLSFVTGGGQSINSFTLPVIYKPNGTSNPVKPMKVVPLHPGVNRFQWNLRYKPAPYVKGYFVEEIGAIVPPTVVPGTYYVELDYKGTAVKQPFVVKLDPRVNTSQEQLQARLDLLLKIRSTLQSLDTEINQAITARDRLQTELTSGRVSTAEAGRTIAMINRDIASMVDLRIQSGEGDLLYETRVVERLTRLQADIEEGYSPLRPDNFVGFSMLSGKAKAGEAKLKNDIDAANKLLGP